MEKLYRSRPFKTRNADEYNLSDILSLFVNPIDGLSSPLDFENSIIKGRMGSGKTMYLRANYAYYLFNLVPRLIEQRELILPVFIKLSDFQHLKNSSDIYKALIIKIVEELSTIYLRLQDAREMANIHLGMKKLKSDILFDDKLKNTSKQLLQLGSEEYIQKIGVEFGLNAKGSYRFVEASASFKENEVVEIKQKRNPGIGDIYLAYDTLLKDSGGKILLLIDEAGSLDKTFFRVENGGESLFEVFMNQLRTTDYIRTKVAIYPNSYSDILTETRYGDVISLEEDIDTLENYKNYRQRVEGIIENYLNIEFETPQIKVAELFQFEDDEEGDPIEELINGSGGNYRRLIQLLDSAMNEAFKRHGGRGKIEHQDAILTLQKHCQQQLSLFSDLEREHLLSLAKVCKSRSTYRFKYLYNAQVLYKYMTKSQEFNLVKVVEAGTGRRGTTYAFDYAYCVLNDLPTHYVRQSEKIDKFRSLRNGEWITRVTNINNEVIAQAEIPNKIDGEISYLTNGKGFIKGLDENEYFFSSQYIIDSDSTKAIWVNKKVRFNPSLLGDSRMATDIEIL
jgi:hypothetical protein